MGSDKLYHYFGERRSDGKLNHHLDHVIDLIGRGNKILVIGLKFEDLHLYELRAEKCGFEISHQDNYTTDEFGIKHYNGYILKKKL